MVTGRHDAAVAAPHINRVPAAYVGFMLINVHYWNDMYSETLLVMIVKYLYDEYLYLLSISLIDSDRLLYRDIIAKWIYINPSQMCVWFLCNMSRHSSTRLLLLTVSSTKYNGRCYIYLAQHAAISVPLSLLQQKVTFTLRPLKVWVGFSIMVRDWSVKVLVLRRL